MKVAKDLGPFEYGDRLWLVRPLWDEGDEWDAAEGTAHLVLAPSEQAAREVLNTGDHGWPTWIEVHAITGRSDLPSS